MQRGLHQDNGKPVADRAGVNARLTAAATAEHDTSIQSEEQQQQQLIRWDSGGAGVTLACVLNPGQVASVQSASNTQWQALTYKLAYLSIAAAGCRMLLRPARVCELQLGHHLLQAARYGPGPSWGARHQDWPSGADDQGRAGRAVAHAERA